MNITKTNLIKRSSVMTALLAAVATLSLSLVLGGSWNASTAQAQTETMPGTITVVGEGKVSIEPDIARANIGVEVSDSTVAEASAENKRLIESILTALAEQGIDEKDLQTSGFNIFAERFGPSGPLSDEEVQYRVMNTVSVVIRDLDRVGDILDAAIDAGANSIHGITFQVEDPGSAENEARQSAVADARMVAEELAALTNVSIGEVVSISEVIGGNGGFVQNNFAAVSDAAGGGGFVPGELEMTMRLQITYAIAQGS